MVDFMKKIFFLIIGLLFFTSGCSVEYELTFDEAVGEVSHIYTKENSHEVYQNVDFNTILQSYTQAYVPVYFDENDGVEIGSEKIEGVDYYNLKPYKSVGVEGFTSSYQFDYSSIYRSRMIKQCFDEVSVQKSGSIYRINTSRGCNAYLNYPLLDDLTIELVSKYDVISSNADKVENGHYYWYFNKDNQASKYISFVFNRVHVDLSGVKPGIRQEEGLGEKLRDFAQEHRIVIIVGFFMVFLVALIILILMKNKKK